MVLPPWPAGTSSFSLQLSTHPSGLGGLQEFAALTSVSLHSQGSAAARFVMSGSWEPAQPNDLPQLLPNLSTRSSQGCSE